MTVPLRRNWNYPTSDPTFRLQIGSQAQVSDEYIYTLQEETPGVHRDSVLVFKFYNGLGGSVWGFSVMGFSVYLPPLAPRVTKFAPGCRFVESFCFHVGSRAAAEKESFTRSTSRSSTKIPRKTARCGGKQALENETAVEDVLLRRLEVIRCFEAVTEGESYCPSDSSERRERNRAQFTPVLRVPDFAENPNTVEREGEINA
ncbi:hypothetical protein EV421DRAFT_1740074 [Armillaria borealis]|uniref:Uncharacterized protein n=1 Tax=Armillaria borealis TaxID=47425 RepID=A0AA39MI17_9AGAR|nr:hypothetical protein EV421DRAFT_1740074 [Armillaria borealis]